MAQTPVPTLTFNRAGCPDCGRREVGLPPLPPPVGDDFDWLQRDYDSFRLAMLEELAARFPERAHWTPADMEVVLVETLAVVLDQLSDMLDRIHAEAYLETARRPDSVWRLLEFIGYDPLESAGLKFDPSSADERAAAKARLLSLWLDNPHRMAEAKINGPRSIHRQRRIVTSSDYATQLAAHPLVERAEARARWTGSWTTLEVACICLEITPLDSAVADIFGADTQATADLMETINAFHLHAGFGLPYWDAAPTVRSVIREFIDAYRMAGQEVWLCDPVPVPVVIDITVLAADTFYRSEVDRAVRQVMGKDHGGYFSPARLHFGEDLHASDLVAAVMALDGVETVCLNRFKRLGDRYDDQSDGGRIVLEATEVAICDNDPGAPERGVLRIHSHGGLEG